LNDEIKALTSPSASSGIDPAKRLPVLEREIAHAQHQYDEARSEARGNSEPNSEVFDEIGAIRAEINELIVRRDQIRADLPEWRKQPVIPAKAAESRKRYGIGSISEGLRRMDEINERIERETLTNGQLRK
jgi:hypothetical protein